MNAKKLQVIKARAENATPGPWETNEDELETFKDNQYERFATIHARDCDAEFIKHAREDVPALVAEVERLQSENAKFAESILNDTYDEFVHTAEIDKLKRENEILKHIIEQMVSKKMYKQIIDFAEGRLRELPTGTEDAK